MVLVGVVLFFFYYCIRKTEMFGSSDFTRRIFKLKWILGVVCCWIILNHTLEAEGADGNPVPVGISVDRLYTEDQTVNEGESVTLQCDIIPPNAVIGERHWKKDGERISSADEQDLNNRYTFSEEYGTNDLTIRNILRSDAGSYTCFVEDKSTGQSFWKDETSQLTVYYMDSPELVYQLNVIVLRCKVESSHPEVNNCIWKFKNKDIDQNSERYKFYENNCRLEIEDSTLKDEGKYECWGENGILSKVNSVVVEFPKGSTVKFNYSAVVSILSTLVIILSLSCSFLAYKLNQKSKKKY